MFTCQNCKYTTPELKDAIKHATGNISHSLTKLLNDEGSVMTVEIVQDDEDGEYAEDGYYEDNDY